jgi:hypothetical protein
MVEGIPELKSTHEGIWKGCALGNNIKKTFPSNNNRSKETLDLIHSDVCGPMPIKYLGGALYYLTFIDEYSRKMWLYLLKSKDEVFNKFQEFKAEVENLTNKKIKTLRTDNGGEYTSREFVAFCKSVGIRRELTVPHNPQQNGVVERKNRYIEESVKALLNDQDLSMFLWGEAAMKEIYVQNRSPHRILKDMTPEEAFSGKKPNVEKLRIFGCQVYSHIPKDKRNKLEPSGKKGIFVGYSDSSKAYRIYIPDQHNIEVSRDVTFNERMAFRKSIEETIEEEEIEELNEENTEGENNEKDQLDHPMEICENNDPDNIPKNKKIPACLEATLQDVERIKVPEGTSRKTKRPKRFSSYAAYMTKLLDEEPTTFEEAVKKEQWKEAMAEEHQSIMRNEVWEIVPRPKEKSIVTSKWVYKIKHAVDGSVDKYKEIFVARGFSQKEGEDYDKIFAPVARYTSIRTIISLVASMGWNLHQMDVKTTFLKGAIEEEVYIEQPQGFEVHSRDNHVCRLKKFLYGLKQAPRAWYARMDSYLTRLGFSKSHADPNLYYKVVNNAPVILLLYVDDIFITGEESLIIQCKKDLASEFDMKDLGLMHYYLGLEVWQKRGEVFLGQGKYEIKILQKFGMMDCKSMNTPMNVDIRKVKVPDSDPVDPSLYHKLIGSLMYLVNTRPDICFVVNTLSQFQVEPRQEHWIAAKHVLRYIRGTINYGLRYTTYNDIQLHGFTDSDWAGITEDRKSTSGMCFSLGSAMISWSNRKQKSVALSTVEAEYMGACEACTEAVWLRKLVSDLFDQNPESITIYCDNQSCIRLSEHLVFHERSKHIEIKYYFIRDKV